MLSGRGIALAVLGSAAIVAGAFAAGRATAPDPKPAPTGVTPLRAAAAAPVIPSPGRPATIPPLGSASGTAGEATASVTATAPASSAPAVAVPVTSPSVSSPATTPSSKPSGGSGGSGLSVVGGGSN